MKCTSCKGEGKTFCHINTGMDSSQHRWEHVTCLHCNGTGQLNADWVARGELFRQARRALKLSIIDAAKLLGVGIVTISSMEFGKQEPFSPSVLDVLKNKAVQHERNHAH